MQTEILVCIWGVFVKFEKGCKTIKMKQMVLYSSNYVIIMNLFIQGGTCQ